MKKCVSVFMVLIMALSIVFGSFSVSFAANNEGDSFLYSSTTYKYSFDDLLDEYLQTCDGLGTVFTYQDVFFVLKENVGYMPAYNKNIDGSNWASSFLGKNDRINVVEQATYIENHLGYIFELFPEQSLVKIVGGYPAKTIASHYYTGADGNRLMSGGGGSGAGREHPYYTTPGTDNTLPGSGDNYYMGDTVTTQIIDNSTGAFNNIGNDNVINAGEGDFIYNPDNRTWYVTSHEDNRTYTTNNYYTYNTVNYYMPGSDQPLNTWNYFYELPDGRNSATLTEEDIAGLNLDFDVVNYKSATEDLSQKALFHFDGNIDNSAPPSNRGLVPGENVFTNNFSSPRRNWYSLGSDLYSDYGNPSSSSFNSTDGVLSFNPSASIWYQTSVFYFSQGLTADNYLIEMDVEGLQALPALGELTVALIDRNNSDGLFAGRTRFTNISDGKISILADVSTNSNFDSNWGLYFSYTSQYSAAPLTISNISVRPIEWQYSDSTSFNSAEFAFQQGAGFTFVDTQTPFNAALYLDGNAHVMNITLPDDSLSSVSDFTYSFRHYQEESTSTSYSYVSIGASPGSDYTDASRISIIWNGMQFLRLEYRDSSKVGYVSSSSAVIPVGQWNTVTLTRSSNNFLLYFNGLLVSHLYVPGDITFADDSNIVLSYAADSNVKYLDEVLFASQSLYTENHVPRLIPWDTTNVLVLPDVTENSIAVQATLPITGWRIGGVRPTFPDEGMVWMMVEGDYITMIQIYNGYMWVQVNGAVYYNGHWYQLENFNIHVSYDDIDTPPDSDVVNPNDQNNNPDSSGGSGGSGGGWLQDILKQLLSGIIDIIMDLIKALVSLIGRVLNAITDFLGAIASNIVGLFDFMSPIAGFTTGFFGALPADIQTVYVSAFALLVFAGILLFIGKH